MAGISQRGIAQRPKNFRVQWVGQGAAKIMVDQRQNLVALNDPGEPLPVQLIARQLTYFDSIPLLQRPARGGQREAKFHRKVLTPKVSVRVFGTS
jgi:hypothetical protein